MLRVLHLPAALPAAPPSQHMKSRRHCGHRLIALLPCTAAWSGHTSRPTSGLSTRSTSAALTLTAAAWNLVGASIDQGHPSGDPDEQVLSTISQVGLIQLLSRTHWLRRAV